MPMYGYAIGWATVEVKDLKENRGTRNNIMKWQTYEMKINSNFGKIVGHFCTVFQIIKARDIKHF